MKNKKSLQFIIIRSIFDYKFFSEDEIINESVLSNDIIYINYLSVIKNLNLKESNLKVLIYNIADKQVSDIVETGALLIYNNSYNYYINNKWYDMISPKSFLIFKNYYCVILKEKENQDNEK